MKPVDQTRFGEEGNCFAACVASILEVPLGDVPDPAELHRAGRHWVCALNQWLAERGLWYQELLEGSEGWRMWRPPTFHVIGGRSPRGVADGHAVVGYQGRIVHDPHPSRAGLEKVEEFGYFVHLFKQ